MSKLDEFWGIYKYLWQYHPDLVLIGVSLSVMLGGCLAYLITR